jgi:DNA-binding transcriptional LysR family regulator
MNLDDISYFLAITEAGLLHRAAEYIGVSQPALTKSVHRLEHQLGVRLFDRSRRGMRLTADGESFLRHATSLRASYSDMLSHMASTHTKQCAKIRVCATPASELLVSQAYLMLLKRRPMTHAELVIKPEDKLLDDVARGDIDIAVAPADTSSLSDDLEFHALFDERIWIVCNGEHPLAQADNSLCARDLSEHPWVLPPETTCTTRGIRRYFQDNGLNPPLVQVVSDHISPNTVFSLISKTNLLGLCSTQLKDVADTVRLKELNITGEQWNRTMSVITRRTATQTPIAGVFIELLISIASELRLQSQVGLNQVTKVLE